MHCLKCPLIPGSQNGVSVPGFPSMQPFSPVSLTAQLHPVQSRHPPLPLLSPFVRYMPASFLSK